MALEDGLLSSDEKKEEKRETKPEAKLAPYLFVQEGTLDNTKRSFRSENFASSDITSLITLRICVESKLSFLDILELRVKSSDVRNCAHIKIIQYSCVLAKR